MVLGLKSSRTSNEWTHVLDFANRIKSNIGELKIIEIIKRTMKKIIIMPIMKQGNGIQKK